MKPEIKSGQRWRYKDSYYDFILEVIEVNRNIIVQNILGSTKIGDQYNISNFDDGPTWKFTYLEGQDASRQMDKS